MENQKRDFDRRSVVDIELDFPVQLADRKLAMVSMRRPIMRDMLKHNLEDGGLPESIGLLADLCGLVPDEIELMDTCDYEKLQKQLLSFRGIA